MFDWDLIAPAGFSKINLSNHEPSVPWIDKVEPITGENNALRQIAKSAKIYRVNAPCSEIPKRRYNNLCCKAKKQEIEVKGPQFARQGCPSNESPKMILSSSQNLLARDSSRSLHTFHAVLTMIPNPNSKAVKDSCNAISKKESSLKITNDKIACQRAKKIEMGVYYPAGADYMSIKLNESRKLVKCAPNPYIWKSSVYQAAVARISEYCHRFARPFPTASQIHSIALYSFIKAKNGAWSVDELTDINRGLKIYDPRFKWRHSNFHGGSQVLPPIKALLNRIDRELDYQGEFFGSDEESEEKKMLLEQITNKIIGECQDERQIVLDSEHTVEAFRRLEFTGETLDLSVIRTGMVMNEMGSRETKIRAPPNPNNLQDIELSLRPSTATMAKFMEKQNPEQLHSELRYWLKNIF